MKREKFIMLLLITSFFLGFSTINADADSSPYSTHHQWRICSATWTKSDFKALNSSAPNVGVKATWAVNLTTGLKINLWSVTNSTKDYILYNGDQALPRIIVAGYGSVAPTNYKTGTCTISNLPLGTEPWSLPLYFE